MTSLFKVNDRVEWIGKKDRTVRVGDLGTIAKIDKPSPSGLFAPKWPIQVIFDHMRDGGTVPCDSSELRLATVNKTQQEVVDPSGLHWHVHGTRIGIKSEKGTCLYCPKPREWNDERGYRDAPPTPANRNSYDWGWADGYNAAVKAWYDWTEEQG